MGYDRSWIPEAKCGKNDVALAIAVIQVEISEKWLLSSQLHLQPVNSVNETKVRSSQAMSTAERVLIAFASIQCT